MRRIALLLAVLDVAQGLSRNLIVGDQAGCPSVFVYDFKGNKHLSDLENPEKPWGTKLGRSYFFNTNQYALAEVMLHRVKHSSRCKRVTDPDKADAFIVAVLPKAKMGSTWKSSCAKHSITHEELMAALPHMTEANAHKHVFFVGKGHPNAEACETWWKKPQGLLRKAWRMSYSDSWAGEGQYGQESQGILNHEVAFRQKNLLKTDSVDFENMRSVPYVSNVHWSTKFTEHPPWSKATGKRKQLMAFFGTDKTKTEYSKKIRPFIFKKCKKYGRLCKIGSGDHLDMFKAKQHTTFCLEPPGDSPYRKSTSESILAGCIPVLFSRQSATASPIHWGSWRDKSMVYIQAEDLYNGNKDLKKVLSKISESEIMEMQKVIAKHGVRMQYALDDVPNDAVEVILRHVAGWKNLAE